MPNYVQLLRKINEAYGDSGNGFHPPDAAEKISEALAGFAGPFGDLARVIDRRREGRYAREKEYAVAWRDLVRLLESQKLVLESAAASAARADNAKINRTIVDQPVQVRRAMVQQAADKELLTWVENLIRQALQDAIEAGELPPDNDFEKLGPVNLKELRESIDRRSAPKEDKITAEQLALISGQSSENPDRLGDLP
jgi:hypothetical protein